MSSSGRGGFPGGLPGEDSRTAEERARGFGGGGWSFGEYMAHKRAGLEEQYASRVHVETSVLAGCVVHVNGATSVPKDTLAELVHKHGGRYAQYPEGNMTHFVVNVLPISKVKRRPLPNGFAAGAEGMPACMFLQGAGLPHVRSYLLFCSCLTQRIGSLPSTFDAFGV
eukprot:scaffold85014_cov36-Tisochrysis_lutea.AAC.4